MIFKISWGTGITLLYSGFVIFILAMVFFAATRTHELVEKDYYTQEIQYQKRIDKQTNSAMLETNLNINYINESKKLVFTFPQMETNNFGGKIKFYRPSDESLDFYLLVEVDSLFSQAVDCSDLKTGLWWVKVDWSNETSKYYFEDKFFIN